MTTVLALLAIFLLIGLVCYHRLGRYLGTTLVGAGIVLLALAGWLPPLLALVLLLLYALAGVVLLATPVRQEWLTRRILQVFRNKLPGLSDTERQAMEAGTVWWEADLLGGRPDWDRFFQHAPSTLTEEEQAFLDGPVTEFCALIDDWQITHRELDLSAKAWKFLKDHGFMGLIIPREYGGKGFSARAVSDVVVRISSRSITAACNILVPNSLGPAKLLLHYGTEQQQQRYLPLLASGAELPCFALTGPEVGSDATNMPDTGVVCQQEIDGNLVLGIRLNWNKRYLTLGPVATVIGLAFRMLDPDHLLGDREDLGITLALVPVDTPGVSSGTRHMPLNLPFQNGPIRGEDVFAPLDWIIGEQNGIGKGWMMLVECLSEGRGISLPALATAGGKLVSRYTGAYARIREQFGTAIGNFEGVQENLAEIGALTYRMDAARLLALSAIDQGEKPGVVSAILKYHLTESMRRVVNQGMDIQGGSGIMLGPRNYLGRVYQALPIAITVEGANILTRSLMIFGQGVVRAHPWLHREMEALALEDEQRAVEAFDEIMIGHLGHAASNGFRSFFLGLSGGRCARVSEEPPLRIYLRHLNHLSAALALTTEFLLLRFGGELKRKEHLSGRLADILSELFVASATLKHFKDQGSHHKDLPLLRWACDLSLWRIEQAFAGLFANLPTWLSLVLRILTFPRGLTRRYPADAITHQVANLLLHPSASRERLTAGIYLSTDPAESIGRLDRALHLADHVYRIKRKIKEADVIPRGDAWADQVEKASLLEVINPEDQQVLQEYETLRREIIQVDDFTAADFVGGKRRTRRASPSTGKKTSRRT